MATKNTPAVKAATPEKSGDGTTVPGLRVVSRPEAFRRAGFAFTSSPTVLKLADLTEKQIAMLTNEPKLVVVEVDVPVDAVVAE